MYIIGKRDAHILLSESSSDTRSAYEIVIGTLFNSQVEVRRHTSITNRIFSLSTPNILQKDEPNEIQVKVSKHGEIQVTVNKYDRFNVQDKSPFTVEYVSFAGYDNSPMEFYYNCTIANVKENVKSEKLFSEIRKEKLVGNVTTEIHQPENSVSIKKVKIHPQSAIEHALLFLNILTFIISIVTLCCIFSKQHHDT